MRSQFDLFADILETGLPPVMEIPGSTRAELIEYLATHIENKLERFRWSLVDSDELENLEAIADAAYDMPGGEDFVACVLEDKERSK